MARRNPKPIPFDQHVWPIIDNPLDMRRRLDFADWLAKNGHVTRADWIRRCCGDCQYARDLRASFSQTAFSTYLCIGKDPLWRPAKELKSVLPQWWQTAPNETGMQQCHFGRITIFELGSPVWIYEGSWLELAWKEGWLEMLHLQPKDEQQLQVIAEAPDQFQAIPMMLDASCTYCSRAPNEMYHEILRFPGLHGLVLCQNDLSIRALNEFGDKAQNLRYLHLLGIQKRNTSIMALEQLKQLPHLRSLTIGNSHPDDKSIQHVVAAKHLEFLGLYGKNITDQAIEQLSDMASLRYLAIDVPRASRNAIEKLRQDRPEITFHIHGDMRERIGPV